MSLPAGPDVLLPVHIRAVRAGRGVRVPCRCGPVWPGWTAGALRRDRATVDALPAARTPPDLAALAAWAARHGVRVTRGV